MKYIHAFIVFCLGVGTNTVFASETGWPFKDNLLIKFKGFTTEQTFNASYQSDNRVFIVGPAILSSDGQALINIASTNKVLPGSPSMDLSYTRNGTTEECQVIFQDGPWRKLAYQGDIAPVCPGLIFSTIDKTDDYNYRLIISKSD